MKASLSIANITLSASLAVSLSAFGQTHANKSPYESGGAACVIAKKLGDSLAIEWATGEPSVALAIDKAKQALQKRGYEYVFPQSNSHAKHGWMVIIKTDYRTYTGRDRTSYGCGFDDRSSETAEQKALTNLRSYSWGWKPSSGYEVLEKQQY